MDDVVIYHNAACGTSRNTLGLIRHAGVEPHVIEYLKTPPSRAMLQQLIARMGVKPRALLREKENTYTTLGLDDTDFDDDVLIDAMVAHPVLINRPVVISKRGVQLCRPSELVIALLPNGLPSDFTKEDGEVVPAGRV
jgi:arsenate reductase (glutaredoxin)